MQALDAAAATGAANQQSRNNDWNNGPGGRLNRNQGVYVMKKNVSMIRKASGLGLAGVMALGASSAMAADFGASADVQSTLTVTVVNDMSFGTLFAASASSGEWDALTLEPAGTITNPAAPTSTNFKLLSLGGTIQPAQATVATSQTFTVDLPDDIADDTIGSGTISGDSNAFPLTIAGGDPDVAKLYVGNFTVGEIVGGSDTANGAAPDIEIDPDFDATEVTFNIGANIYTDDGAGNGGTRETYEDGTYSGTFPVTASF